MSDSSAAPEPIKPASSQPEPASDEPVEGVPVLPPALAEARERLEAAFSGLEFTVADDQLEVRLPADRLFDLARFARDELGYQMLMSITGVDYKERYEVVYHLYKVDAAFPIVLRCSLPHEDAPEVPSLTPIWPGADFQEREVYDLMGIVFTGHPDLRRILLADDFPGHPLRKDWEPDPDYVLVKHLRLPGYAGAQRGETSTGRFLDG